MSDYLQPHGLQHDRLPRLSLSLGVCSNSCPLNQWCYLTMSSSAALFSFCLQSFLASGFFSNESTLQSGGQSTGASVLLSVLPSEYSGLISFKTDCFNLLVVQGTLKSLFQHHSLKASFLQCSTFFMVQLSHPNTTTGKTTALSILTFVGKLMSLFLICCLGLSPLSLQGTSVF